MTQAPRRPFAFSLIELLVVIAIIALLVGIIAPSLKRAKAQASISVCRAHLRQLMIANVAYAALSNNRLPAMKGFNDSGTPEDSVETGTLHTSGVLTAPKLWLCPKDNRPEDTYAFSFTLNMRVELQPQYDTLDGANASHRLSGDDVGRRISTLPSPSRTILLAEENTDPAGWPQINDPAFLYHDYTEDRHLGMSQVGYLDGSAVQIPPGIQLWNATPNSHPDIPSGTLHPGPYTPWWPVDPVDP